MKRLPNNALLSVIIASVILTGCGADVSDTPSDTDSASTATATANGMAEAEATTGDEVEATAPTEDANPGTSFIDGVLTTGAFVIKITDHRVIPAGEEGNEYGDVPVLAIWYDTTNLGTSDSDVTPMDFIFWFQAYQDNDPNRENTLQVGSLPDETFLDTQTESIKPNGTLANAVAFELDDTETPVDLVAESLLGDEIGRMTIKLN